MFGDGGGIYVEGNGTLNVANSAFSGNSATGGWGGGIANQGMLTVTNVTFSNNSADGAGGGITNSGVLTVTNSTFSGNSAGGGGGIINSGVLTVTNSTFSGNSATFGSGIYNSGIMTLYNTLVAANIGEDCYGTLTADSFNLDSDGSCDNATQKTVGQINLGPLADNGGSTQTMALLPGSAAIDAGNNAVCPATDQRGVARPQGACDVGAFEVVKVYLPLILR
jgi:predicted outer membrane repeat protein